MNTSTPRAGQRSQDLTWVVALAAAMWGTSALMREPLLDMGLTPSLLVLSEHLVLVLCLSPWLLSALGHLRAAPRATQVSVLLIGVGASAVATTLFTAAFSLGDPVTPQVLQKLQPVFAIVLATLLLRERLRRRFWAFAVPALAGAWLLAFPSPFGVDVASAQAALLSVGAAALWAAGTVLGRLASTQLSVRDLTGLRFFFGLLTMLVVVTVKGEWEPVPVRGIPLIVVLAAVPGLLALTLYYRGLHRTPASRATLAELAFPLTAAAIGVGLLGTTLVWSQWVGFAIVLVSITGLALHEHAAPRPAVLEPERRDAAPVSAGAR
jgi:drug/metabolite transporter (DMT)-like permease